MKITIMRTGVVQVGIFAPKKRERIYLLKSRCRASSAPQAKGGAGKGPIRARELEKSYPHGRCGVKR